MAKTTNKEFKKVMGYARALITSGEVLGEPYYQDDEVIADIPVRSAAWYVDKEKFIDIQAIFLPDHQIITISDFRRRINNQQDTITLREARA